MKKIYINLKVKLIIRQDEDADTDHILNELDYNFKDTTGKAEVEDTEILDYAITDAK